MRRRAAALLAFILLLPHTAFAHTVEGRVREFGPAVSKRLMPYFLGAGIAYPPRKLTFVGLKEEKILEVYAAGSKGRMRFLRSYPILAASGGSGPKLRQGDGQVPEGIYRIDAFNPDSLFHVSMRVNYPNADDKARAVEDGRTDLGGDIFIHGGAASIGCLAVGDQAAEDLFVMAALAKLQNVKVILSPVDFRKREPKVETEPVWTKELYSKIRKELAAL
ncbi:MAG TPA: L,D-transpeptidase family protein [bacterium]|nr:L,D-transpeptidase family protein [bacterium]